MKTLSRFTVLAMLALGVLLAGCATTAPQKLTPAQILSIACPPIQASMLQFQALAATMPTVPNAAKASDSLAKLQPIVAAACTSGATVSIANVHAFAQSVLPVLGQVAGTLPLPPAQMAQVQAGLIAAEIAVGAIGIVEQQIQAAKAAPASASTVPTPSP